LRSASWASPDSTNSAMTRLVLARLLGKRPNLGPRPRSHTCRKDCDRQRDVHHVYHLHRLHRKTPEPKVIGSSPIGRTNPSNNLQRHPSARGGAWYRCGTRPDGLGSFPEHTRDDRGLIATSNMAFRSRRFHLTLTTTLPLARPAST
jgi:hypothetical protein